MILEEKKAIRNTIKTNLLNYRENFEYESETIFHKIINSNFYKNADTILSYMALPDEVYIPINKLLNTSNKTKNIYIPKVKTETTEIDFYKYTETLKVQTGAYNIQEPSFEGEIFPLTDKAKLSEMGNILVLVPGRAFTKEGQRLGRGKGYYDRFLYELLQSYNRNKIILAGVCFKPQITKELPEDKHDIKMDFIFTAE